MRARNYNEWLNLQQEWRKSGKASVPDSELARRMRLCVIDLLREVCSNTDLDTPHEVLYQLADQLETLHSGSKATYLLPDRFNTSNKGDPTYAALRATAVGFVLKYPDGSVDQAKARKTVQDTYGIAEQTVSKWVVKMRGGDDLRADVDESILRFSGALYQNLTSEEEDRRKAKIEDEFSDPHT